MEAEELIKDFGPCPFCGKTDKLELTPEKNYSYLCGIHGSAAVRVSCCRCHIDMYDHTVSEHDYYTRIGILREKWSARYDETSA